MRSFSIENDRRLLPPKEFFKRLQKLNPGDPKNRWVLDPYVGGLPVWQHGIIIVSDQSFTTLKQLAGPELTVVPLTLIDQDPMKYIEDLVDSIGRIMQHGACPG